MKKIEGYTKGPWAVLDTAGETIIADRPGEGMFSIASTKNHSAIGDQQRANAELIASAPETYERCQKLEAMMKEMIGQCDKAEMLIAILIFIMQRDKDVIVSTDLVKWANKIHEKNATGKNGLMSIEDMIREYIGIKFVPIRIEAAQETTEEGAK